MNYPCRNTQKIVHGSKYNGKSEENISTFKMEYHITNLVALNL